LNNQSGKTFSPADQIQESAITAMGKQPIVAFVFNVKGIMAGMSIRGAKFNKLDKSK
jgi:lipid-binding SYLF domain-containing protein